MKPLYLLFGLLLQGVKFLTFFTGFLQIIGVADGEAVGVADGVADGAGVREIGGVGGVAGK